MEFTNRDIELINSVSSDKFNCSSDINKLSKDEALDLTDLLGNLIGYDSIKKDIDALGLEADNVISKLLIMLEKRGEM